MILLTIGSSIRFSMVTVDRPLLPLLPFPFSIANWGIMMVVDDEEELDLVFEYDLSGLLIDILRAFSLIKASSSFLIMSCIFLIASMTSSMSAILMPSKATFLPSSSSSFCCPMPAFANIAA